MEVWNPAVSLSYLHSLPTPPTHSRATAPMNDVWLWPSCWIVTMTFYSSTLFTGSDKGWEFLSQGNTTSPNVNLNGYFKDRRILSWNLGHCPFIREEETGSQTWSSLLKMGLVTERGWQLSYLISSTDVSSLTPFPVSLILSLSSFPSFLLPSILFLSYENTFTA